MKVLNEFSARAWNAASMSEHDSPDSTNPSEIEALIARLKHGSLNNQDTLLIERLLRLLLTLIRVVEQKNTSISRLKRMLFGPGADKRCAHSAAPATPPGKDTPSVWRCSVESSQT